MFAALLISLCLSVPSQDAFSLLAYSDPWNCPVGQQLDPIQREPVCAALNSAILGKSCFLWECFPRHTCSQGLSCGRQACQKYLCLGLTFLSLARDCQGSNAGRGVGGKPAESRFPDTLIHSHFDSLPCMFLTAAPKDAPQDLPPLLTEETEISLVHFLPLCLHALNPPEPFCGFYQGSSPAVWISRVQPWYHHIF